MSRGVDREEQEESTVLRRNERQRKRTIVNLDNRDSDSDTEIEGPGDWDLKSVIAETSGSNHSFGESPGGISSVLGSDKKGNNSQREERNMSRESGDSGKGATPEPGLESFF